MLQQFTPEVPAQLLPEIYAKRVTLRQGVRQMLKSIPSSSYPSIVEFARSQTVQAGFLEFIDFWIWRKFP
jgi:2-hydroxy-3-keto-5-methylthiopentenyl-1-phosphate phosphatase